MDFSTAIAFLIPLILSLTVHEYAHARVAMMLGDNTARLSGRLTLNPLPHIDPIGTLAFPLMAILFGAPVFGWAKPVPVDPRGFRRQVSSRAGMMWVAAAGPISNVVLAFLAAIAFQLMVRSSITPSPAILELLRAMFLVNLALAIFNMIPIPPLDGSRILEGLAPRSFQPVLQTMQQYSFLLFIGVLLLGRQYIGLAIGVLGGVIQRVVAAGFGLFG